MDAMDRLPIHRQWHTCSLTHYDQFGDSNDQPPPHHPPYVFGLHMDPGETHETITIKQIVT